MTSAHTPGPWNVLFPVGPEHPWIEAGDHGGWVGEQYMSVSGQISEADAHLIAAAPDMLAALYEAEEYFDNRADADCDQDGFIPNEEMKLLTVVRDAISKAERQS